MALARGIRGPDNLNPLNVKQGADPWAGSDGKDEIGHARFVDPAYSIRAMLRLAWVYSRRYRLTTLRRMFERYAPTGDGPNNPAWYAGVVGRAIGKGIDEEINIFDTDGTVVPRGRNQLIDGINAMIEVECGAGIKYDRATLERGIAIYHLLLKRGAGK